jgi:DNA-binding response OmpR family regulator
MAHLNLLRILYVGRKTDVIASLQTLFEQQNSLIGSNGAERPAAIGQGIDGLPLIEFKAVTSQKAALQFVRTYLPFVILVEIENRPDSRVRLCEMIRYRLRTAAIVAIGAHQPTSSFAFDGYINLPLVFQQVLETVLRIRRERVGYQLQHGPLCLNIATRTVTTAKGEYGMTPKQCALLEMLMLNHGKVVQRSDIMQLIWETSYLEDTRTLDVHVRWLRERIEPDPSSPIYLQTVRGVGYKLLLGV